jgi:hypothetical protein
MRSFLALSLLSLLAVTFVSAQGFLPSPGSSQKPAVFCQVAFNKISKVDGVEQLFTADFYMQTMWFDLDRQNEFGAAWNTSSGRMPPTNNGVGGNFQFTPYFQGWYDPLIEFVNAANAVEETGQRRKEDNELRDLTAAEPAGHCSLPSDPFFAFGHVSSLLLLQAPTISRPLPTSSLMII